jgi:hypothetical protein
MFGIKLIQISVAAALGVAAFAGVTYYMVNQEIPAPARTDNREVLPRDYKFKTEPDEVPEPPKPPVKKKKKRAPNEPPLYADMLKLLGKAADSKLTTHLGGRENQVAPLINEAHKLTGKEIYPNVFETIRYLKQSPWAEYLAITPGNQVTIQDITDLIGEPRSTMENMIRAKSQRCTWHRYSWIEFGTVGGNVLTVWILCSAAPTSL